MIETTSIVCGHVFSQERDVGVVVHHSDGVWQLVCGGHDHPVDCSDFQTVGLEHLLERQPSLQDVVEKVPRGWMAEWTGNEWTFSAHDD